MGANMMENNIAAESTTINHDERSIDDQPGSISHDDRAIGDQNMSTSAQDRSTSSQDTSINAQDRSVNVEETTHIQGNHCQMLMLILISKMVLLELLLPTFDLGTDLLAIYSYWSSNQWVLNYLSIGLAICLMLSNLASGLYGLKSRSTLITVNGPQSGITSMVWKAGGVVLYGLGLGNIPTTIEVILQFIATGNLDPR